MFNKIQSRLFRWLDTRKQLPEEELYRYVLMMAVSVMAISVHLLFFVFFSWVGSVFLAVSHGAGAMVSACSCWLLTRRRYDVAGVVVTLIILFCTFATIVIIGGDNFTILYQVLVLLMLLVIPFTNSRIPVVFCALLPFLMAGGYLYDIARGPLHVIGDANHVLAVMNILVASFGTILLMLLERSVRVFVENFKTQHLEELRTQANIDPLTGLYNRRYAADLFERMRDDRRVRTSCVAIADIDDFKVVNDTYGHNVGDVVLRSLSGVFTAYLRKSDAIIRWGGEEFLLILMDVELPEARQLLERTREAIAAQVIQAEGCVVQVTITLGVAPMDYRNVEGSLALCDRRLYEGKRNGKNQVVAG